MKIIIIGFMVLLIVSLGIGLGVNAVRNQPLSLVYERPSQRLAGNAERAVSVTSAQWNPGINIIDLKMTGDLVDENSAIIVDARSDLFFEFGHIPGAKNLARKNFEADYVRLEKWLAPAKEGKIPVLVYCSNLHCEDAGKVAEKLKKLGFPIILLFEGGYKEWESAGMKTAQGK